MDADDRRLLAKAGVLMAAVTFVALWMSLTLGVAIMVFRTVAWW